MNSDLLWTILQDGGTGFLGVVIGAIITSIQYQRRLNQLESDAQTKAICNERHKIIDVRLDNIQELQKQMSEKLDKLIMWHMNGGKK